MARCGKKDYVILLQSVRKPHKKKRSPTNFFFYAEKGSTAPQRKTKRRLLLKISHPIYSLPFPKGGYKFSLKIVTFYMYKGTHSANNFINLYELLWGKEKNVVRWVLHITISRISICQMVDAMKMIYALSAKE